MNAGMRSGKGWRKEQSAPLAVRKHQCKMIQNHIPIPEALGPLFGNVVGGQIQHFAQRIVVGKDALGLYHLAELPVKPFNNIGGIYTFPNGH